MFLPKSKYKGPFTATGGEKELLVKDTLKPYRGPYILTYKNQYFAGKTPQEAKQELVLKSVYEENEQSKNKIIPPKATIVQPSEKDYKNKSFTRYFTKDKRSGKILEVDKTEFNRVKKIPAHLTVSLNWYLEGPAEDTRYRGYMYYGASTRNRNTVLEANKSLPGIKNYLKDLSEFVV